MTPRQKKLTITIDEDVYRGLYERIGTGKISRFIEQLVRPHVLPKELDDAYATLNGEPLHDEYQIHFMVTQGMRDRETLVVRGGAGAEAGAVNPAQMQLDFYIRSPEANEANHPTREVFDHFFAMDVTWR